jgi:hypothetical protein
MIHYFLSHYADYAISIRRCRHYFSSFFASLIFSSPTSRRFCCLRFHYCPLIDVSATLLFSIRSARQRRHRDCPTRRQAHTRRRADPTFAPPAARLLMLMNSASAAVPPKKAQRYVARQTRRASTTRQDTRCCKEYRTAILRYC